MKLEALAPLEPLAYSVILIDPPWRFVTRSEKGTAKSPQRHYRTMTLQQIAAMPIAGLADDDCLLFMWATWPVLPRAIWVLQAWGFEYKTGGSWTKETAGGKVAFGTGYIMRSATEPFLIGTRGRPRIKSRSERNLIEALRREHSRKPDDQYEILDRLVHGRRCEIFSRSDRPGWESWGDEAGKFNA